MLFVSSFSWPHRFTKVWAHRTSLSPPFRLEMPVPSQESEWPCNCVLRGIPVSILPLSTIFLLDFGTDPTVWYFRTDPTVWYFRTVPTVWYFFVFHFITLLR